MVFNKVRDLIVDQFGVEEESITENTLFVEDLDADSLAIVELSMAVEEEFGIGELEDEEVSGLKTVGDLVRFIQSKLDEE
jgi:acyl carrier protein